MLHIIHNSVYLVEGGFAVSWATVSVVLVVYIVYTKLTKSGSPKK